MAKVDLCPQTSETFSTLGRQNADLCFGCLYTKSQAHKMVFGWLSENSRPRKMLLRVLVGEKARENMKVTCIALARKNRTPDGQS